MFSTTHSLTYLEKLTIGKEYPHFLVFLHKSELRFMSYADNILLRQNLGILILLIL